MVQASDRLYEDYRHLSESLGTIGDGLREISAFDDQDHPLYGADYLMRHAGWIGSSWLGKALASAVLGAKPKPKEWMTSATLSATVIREPQVVRKSNRHHVFPKKWPEPNISTDSAIGFSRLWFLDFVLLHPV